MTNRHVVTDAYNRTTLRTCDRVEVLVYLGQKPRNARTAPIVSQTIKVAEQVDLAVIELEVPDLPADIQPLPLKPEFLYDDSFNPSEKSVTSPG